MFIHVGQYKDEEEKKRKKMGNKTIKTIIWTF